MNYLIDTIRIWWYKQTHFEFFSIKRLYFPITFFYVIKSIMFGSIRWIDYVNPSIYRSGLREHSKEFLLKQLPKKNKIPSLYIPLNSSEETVERIYTENPLTFPLVIKPDYGSRGLKILKAYNLKELVSNIKKDQAYLIQEYVNTECEFAVFYIRYPNEKHGKVVSLVKKEYMSFVGDGEKTLSEIIMGHPRGWLYRDKLHVLYGKDEMNRVLSKGETIMGSFVGSHSGGTIFLDHSHMITKKLSNYIDELTQHIPEFYYGRYDIKAQSYRDLENGNFKILELNAAIGEPVHMYQPGLSISKGYSILLKYWLYMYKIAQQNKRRKVRPVKKPE